jgi:adenylate cyclase
MRCPSCGTDSREGRRFCSSCGASLLVACLVCGSQDEIDERFCGQCGARLDGQAPAVSEDVAAAPEQPFAEEQRLVSVLFADVAGFTSMLEGMDPEAVKTLAGHCADLMAVFHRIDRLGRVSTDIRGRPPSRCIAGAPGRR